MAAILIKNFPPELHRRLKARAKSNHRSMNQEVIMVMEQALSQWVPIKLPPPVKGAFPVTQEFIREAIRGGRK